MLQFEVAGAGKLTAVKIDLKQVQKELYNPISRDFSLVTVPKMNFLMVDGHGDPNTSTAYVQAIEALYAASYTLKFYSKKELDRDYVVPPLEGLWWAEDMDAFRRREKATWHWTMMIRVPDWLTKKEVTAAIEKLKLKKPEIDTSILRFDALEEGLSVQIMHVGSYDDETPTLLKLHDEWIPGNGFKENLKHHEIYIGDPRKTEPSKLKTVLRQPVVRKK